MRGYAFNTGLRVVVLGCLASGVVAAVLGYLAPALEPRFSVHPMRPNSAETIVNAYLVSDQNSAIHVLDPERGRLEQRALSFGSSLFHASYSPHEHDGGTQQELAGVSLDMSTGEYSLTRALLPAGKILDRLPSAVIPAGRLCWDPQTPARVLFAGADGQLYVACFEDTGASDRLDRFPQVVAWKASQLSQPQVCLSDPFWPSGSPLGGRILIALRMPHTTGDRRGLPPARLWWLQLDSDRSAIVAAGPLNPASDCTLEPEADLDERFPSLAVAADGTLFVAYLVFLPGSSAGELRVARLHTDPSSGNPSLEPGGAVTLADQCLRIAPAFSSDARRVSYLVQQGSSFASVRSLEISHLFQAESLPGCHPVRQRLTSRAPEDVSRGITSTMILLTPILSQLSLFAALDTGPS